MRVFYCKTGDTKPMEVKLTYSDGTAVDLTDATVTFYMGTTIAGAPATVLDPPTAGVVAYPWSPGETDTPGDFPAEFNVEVLGSHARMPSKGTLLVKIVQAVVG